MRLSEQFLENFNRCLCVRVTVGKSEMSVDLKQHIIDYLKADPFHYHIAIYTYIFSEKQGNKLKWIVAIWRMHALYSKQEYIWTTQKWTTTFTVSRSAVDFLRLF